MVGCTFTFVGCSESEIPGGGTEDGGGEGGGTNPDIPVTEYDDSQFGEDVIVLTAESGDSRVFADYYGTETKSFNELVDRQIKFMASEILHRLTNVYSGNTLTNQYESITIDIYPYTNWQVGQSVSNKYQVYFDIDNNPYVFLYDDSGNKIVSQTEDNAVWDEDDITYYAVVNKNNIEDYITDYSAYALTAYLQGNTNSDTFGSALQDSPITQMTLLQDTIWGENYYAADGNEINTNTGGVAWAWADYLDESNYDTAIDMFSYAIARIINEKGNILPEEIGAEEYYITDYTNQLSNISYLGNYLEYYYDDIKDYVQQIIIGGTLIENDLTVKNAIDEVKTAEQEYVKTFEYALNNEDYYALINGYTDADNLDYNFLLLYNEAKMYVNHYYANNNKSNKSFSEQYNYFIQQLQVDADIYKEYAIQEFYYAYCLYYGINESGWIDEEQTVKSFNQIEFPYTWERIVASRNYKNYETVIEEVLHSVQNQTFDAGTHAVITNPSYKGYSAFAEMGRVGRDSTITNIHQFGDITVDGDGNEENTYTKASNYRSIIIPAIGNIPDLSHYSLLLCVGDNIEEMSIRVSVQLVDSTGQGEVLVLDKNMAGLIENYPYPDEGMAGGSDDKFIVPQMGNDEGMGNNTWFIEFDLPTSSTTISMAEDEEPFSYGEQSLFDNDFVLEYDEETGEVTYSIVATNCIVITFEVFDASGRELPAGKTIPFGVSLWLDNYHEKEQ